MVFSEGGLPWSAISFLLTSDTECVGKPCDESAISRDWKAKAVTEMSTKNSLDALDEILEDLYIFKSQNRSSKELYMNPIEVLFCI